MRRGDVLIEMVGRLVFLPALMFAAALLVKAHNAPGDGFAAGLVAAMAYVILDLSVSRNLPGGTAVAGPRRTRYGAAGLIPMLAVAFGPMIVGRPLLTHFPHGLPPTVGELQLDTAIVFDAGIAILVVALTVSAIRTIDPQVDEEQP